MLDERQKRARLYMLEYLRSMVEVRKRLELNELAYSGYEELVLKHGLIYTPALRPKGMRKRANRQCFKNAALLALNNPFLTYVEGFAHGTVITTHHAWCVTDSGVVVDPTWYLKPNTLPDLAYYGIPFTIETLGLAITASGTYGVFDDWKHYVPILQEPYEETRFAERLRALWPAL